MSIDPRKLKSGDLVRVIAPSRSLKIISQANQKIAEERLRKLGLRLDYGRHVNEQDQFDSSSVRSRVADLHQAFRDLEVKMIISVIGGYNSNQLLDYLDYKLIKTNPKIFCGYSDITALSNAIYVKTGLVTYSGPHFSSFGMKKGFAYSEKYFMKSLFSSEPYSIEPSPSWSDDAWYKNQNKRKFIRNSGPRVINPGRAQGRIIGGNLCTLNLLQGTRYMPSLRGSVLFLEDDALAGQYSLEEFDRNLQSLIHQPQFKGVRGLVIGRFQKDSKASQVKIKQMIKTKEQLKKLPVIADADFGHTYPIFTFPIAGSAEITARGKKVKILINKH